MSELSLAFGFSFDDLYDRSGLVRLDQSFVERLKQNDTELFNRLMTARSDAAGLDDKSHSQLLTDMGPAVEAFVAELFGIEDEIGAERSERDRLNPIYVCKRDFVRRRAAKAFKPDELASADGAALRRDVEALIGTTLNELTFARAVMGWLEMRKRTPTSLPPLPGSRPGPRSRKKVSTATARARCSICPKRSTRITWSPSTPSRSAALPC